MNTIIDKDSLKRFKPFFFRGFIAFVLFYLAFQAFYNQLVFGKFYPYDELWEMLVAVVLNFFPMLILLMANSLFVFRIVRIRNIQIKIVVDFICSIIIVVCFNLCFLLIFHGLTIGKLNWTGTIFCNFVIFLMVETLFYVDRFMRQQQEMEKQRQEVEKKRQEVLKYQYDALKAQVNPHFLFNSLNILTALVDIDVRRAKDFVAWLSQVYRYILSKQNVELARLNEEMEFIRSYTSILAMRYHEKFRIDIQGEEYIGEQKLIPYTLQILVENITKHNVISARQPMTVRMTISKDGIEISNHICLRNSESVSHFGLRYLTTLYSAHGVEFHTENDGTTFTAYIPFIKQ